MVALALFGSVIQIGISLPAAFELAVQKQDRLPLVRVIDYAYKTPTGSTCRGLLVASLQIQVYREG